MALLMSQRVKLLNPRNQLTHQPHQLLTHLLTQPNQQDLRLLALLLVVGMDLLLMVQGPTGLTLDLSLLNQHLLNKLLLLSLTVYIFHTLSLTG